MEDQPLFLQWSRSWSRDDGDRRRAERRSGSERRAGEDRGDRRDRDRRHTRRSFALEPQWRPAGTPQDRNRARRRARDRLERAWLAGPAS